MLFLEALWFFLPILAANQCPGLAAYLHLPDAHAPIIRRWLGENKTIAAYYAAPLGSLGAIYAQQQMTEWSHAFGLFDYNRSDLWLVGLLLGLGAVLGDHIKSFIKRRVGISPELAGGRSTNSISQSVASFSPFRLSAGLGGSERL